MGTVASDVTTPMLAHAMAARGLSLARIGKGRRRIDPGWSALLLAWRCGCEDVGALIRDIRETGWRGPLMLLAEGGGSDAIADALDAGADEAALGTAAPPEIAARLAARLRGPMLRIGELAIDRVARRVVRAGRVLPLLPREYALLLHLAERQGRCVDRASLLQAIWGLGFDPGTNLVEVHVSRLRAKLDRGFPAPMLHTERGRGYRLTAPAAA